MGRGQEEVGLRAPGWEKVIVPLNSGKCTERSRSWKDRGWRVSMSQA